MELHVPLATCACCAYVRAMSANSDLQMHSVAIRKVQVSQSLFALFDPLAAGRPKVGECSSVGRRVPTLWCDSCWHPPLDAPRFETTLWLAIGGFAVAFALVLFVLNWIAARLEGEDEKPSLAQMVMMTYHSVAMVLAGEDFDRWRSVPMRLARVSMPLFVLVFSL